MVHKLSPPANHPPYPFQCYVALPEAPRPRREFASRVLAKPTGTIDSHPFYCPKRKQRYRPVGTFPKIGDEYFQYQWQYPVGAVPAFWAPFHVDEHRPVKFGQSES
ncbi:MAG: hypothetical protein KVP17_004748 [Porospora cf. gigantea B]|uniref:uncharacterized protein n=1 Tax=Porospora cf. gigantea B TaxID=2853592 RepID=UPI003571B75E|nr:MAG: hypothetical protein KVP17_004748 [Porospora cf. gigantea B]